MGAKGRPRRRRVVTYANAVATLALLLSMAGGAVAASRYLINSTRQINPKVLRALRGKAGPGGPRGLQGLTGPQGAAGAAGAEGKPGAPGPLLETLPSGRTLRGLFAGASAGGAHQSVPAVASISYSVPLSSQPNVEVIQENASPTKNCPGSPAAPSAAAGYLCVYASIVAAGAVAETYSPINHRRGAAGDYHLGGMVYVETTCGASPCEAFVEGSWAVTAP